METAQAIASEPKAGISMDSQATLPAVDWDNPRVAAILSAAAKCFARRGFHTTTLAEIGKELGLRKSIVHYYFASKAALVQEVQSFSYKLTLRGIREALSSQSTARSLEDALGSLWKCLHEDATTKGLNVEIWSAMRQDPEIRRRAGVLHADAQKLLAERLSSQFADADSIAALTLAVLDGLSVAEAIHGETSKTRATFDAFVRLASAARTQTSGPSA
jgi:AcrR family transcriptional regulator